VVLYYLDSVIVVYAVEGNPADQLRAINHLTALEEAGHSFAVSELTKAECLVPLWSLGDAQRLSHFFRFFHGPNLRTVELTPAVYTRASAIRGSSFYPAIGGAPARRIGLADALHLAAALESDCGIFLTNDYQLSTFTDIAIEILP
jgi:predicted nucleic acid-binding protein